MNRKLNTDKGGTKERSSTKGLDSQLASPGAGMMAVRPGKCTEPQAASVLSPPFGCGDADRARRVRAEPALM